MERTRFIFEQSKYFDTDPSMQTANKIIYGLSPNFTIETFLRVMDSKEGTQEEISTSMAFEGYLNFLWRVAYAHLHLKTISIEDVTAFGVYFYKIYSENRLREYCMAQGFEEIIELAQKLEPIWRDWSFVRLARPSDPTPLKSVRP